MVAALLHNSTNPQAVFDDLDAIAAANARGHRLLGQVSCCPLTMDFTLAVAVSGRRAGELEAGARPARRGAEARCSPSPSFRDGVRAELATPTTFRLFNGEWDKVQVVEIAQPAHARYEQRTHRRDRARRAAAIRST